jgi:hypothetical protein
MPATKEHMNDLTRLLFAIAGVNADRYNPPKGKGPILDMSEVGNNHFVSKVELASEQGRKESVVPQEAITAS